MIGRNIHHCDKICSHISEENQRPDKRKLFSSKPIDDIDRYKNYHHNAHVKGDQQLFECEFQIQKTSNPGCCY